MNVTKSFLVAIFACILSGNIWAQSGKISGKLTDANTGEPLIGATVNIEGTTIGAQTDIDGNYLILNVAPGTYTLVARYLGYSTLVVQEVIVRTDLTTTRDFKLKMELFEGEEITVVAERRAVIKDITSSESRVSSEEIKKLVVQEVRDVVQLQAGVNVDNGGGIHIRGGRTSEVSYVVDGIRVTDDFDRSQGLRIENESIQELQVISGSFNAEHGQALSGVINVVTKAGNNNFEGSISGFGGGYMVSDGRLYDGLANSVGEYDPFSSSNLSVSFSGPIIKDKLTIFATARQFENDGWLNGRNAFSARGIFRDTLALDTDFNTYRTIYNEQVDFSKPWYSVDTLTVQGQQFLRLTDDGTRDSSLVNLNRFKSYSAQANLQYRPSNFLKFNLIGTYGEEKGLNYNHQRKLVPGGLPENFTRNYSANLKTTITPSSTTFLTLNLANRFNRFKRQLFGDPFDPRHFNFDNLQSFAINDEESEFLTLGRQQQFDRQGTDNNRFFRSTNTFIAKAEISSQLSERHFVKGGLNVQADIIKFDNFTLLPIDPAQGLVLPDDLTEEQRQFAQLAIPRVNTPNHSKFTRKPVNFSAYVQDKIEYDDLIINIGLRFDYFQPNAQIAANPRDPDIFNPTLPENQFRDLNNNGVRDPGEPDVTFEERLPGWFKSASAKTQFSPRFGVAYSLNDRGVIFFSYGSFFQMPSYDFLYANSQVLLSSTSGTQGIFGNPDLDPERSVQYEIGIKQEVFRGTALELTGFVKDTRDYVTAGVPQRTGSTQINWVQWTNRDFSKSRGLTFAINQTVSRKINFGLDYTFSLVEGTNSDPAAEFFRQQELTGADIDTTGASLTKLVQPLDWDRGHIVNGTFFYSGKNWGLNMVGRFLTGTPFTPDNNIPGVIIGPVISSRDLRNTRRLPSRFTLDINLNKDFILSGNSRVNFFLNVFNVFDNQLVNSVFGDSGEPELPLPFNVSANADATFFDDPSRFAEPRRIQFGFQFTF